jgi:hypothetical protein
MFKGAGDSSLATFATTFAKASVVNEGYGGRSAWNESAIVRVATPGMKRQ